MKKTDRALNRFGSQHSSIVKRIEYHLEGRVLSTSINRTCRAESAQTAESMTIGFSQSPCRWMARPHCCHTGLDVVPLWHPQSGTSRV